MLQLCHMCRDLVLEDKGGSEGRGQLESRSRCKKFNVSINFFGTFKDYYYITSVTYGLGWQGPRSR